MEAADIKSVGIIGAGRIGRAMAEIALRAGRQVVISNSRGPRSLTSLVRELGEGVSAGTVEQAAAADMVVLAVMWPQVVVKAGNTLGAAVLASDPRQAGGRRVIFLSGDDADAKSDVVALFDQAGFFVLDLGGLREGGRMQQLGSPLAGHNFVRVP
jgi:hypothetical protein